MSVDLHVELDSKQPSRKELQMILTAARSTVERAVAERLQSGDTSLLTIIHGKGNGVLKQVVHSLLLEYAFLGVRFELNRANEGVTIVRFDGKTETPPR